MLYGLLHNETPLELGAPWERYLNASPRCFPKYTVALIFTEHLVPDCELLEARNRCFSFGFFFFLPFTFSLDWADKGTIMNSL